MAIDQVAFQAAVTKFVADANALIAGANALNAQVQGTVIPPVVVPPNPGTTSPDGTTITAPDTKTIIIDKGGHKFTFSATSSGYGNVILRDGKPYMYGEAKSLTIKSGVVWQKNNSNHWYKDNSDKSWDYSPTGPV